MKFVDRKRMVLRNNSEVTHFVISFGGGDMQCRGACLGVGNVAEPLGVEPRPGVLQHHPLLGVPRLVAVDALLVDLLLEQFLHFI